MNQLLRFLTLLLPYKKAILKIAASAILLSFIGLIGPWVTKVLVDSVLPAEDYDLLTFILLVALALSVFQPLMGMMRQLFATVVGLEMSLDVRLRFYRHLQTLPLSFFDTRQTGEVLSRTNDADQSLGRTLSLVNNVLTNGLSVMVFPAVLLFMNWKLALLGFAVLPADVLIYLWVSRRIRVYSRQVAEKRAELAAKNYELVSGIRVIKSLTLEQKAAGEVDRLMRESQALTTRLSVLQQVSGFAVAVLRGGGTFAYSWYGWHEILGGGMSLGSFLAFSSYVGYLYNPVVQLVEMIQEVQQTIVHATRFFEIYDQTPEAGAADTGYSLVAVKGDIRFRGVAFGYNGSGYVLDGLNLEIDAGSTVAIVGRSGIGKTTIANLMLRFYEPSAGTIMIDGHDIRDVSLSSLRSHIGYVLQEPFLFHGTIGDNVAIAGTSVQRSDIERACRAAGIHHHIVSLPKGYDTQIGERGIQLSQGQKQRICLARVLLLNPAILILDEATSALDLQSEDHIRESLKTLRATRTTVIIAHRLNTLHDADMIHVLDQGRIVEAGTHAMLMRDGAVYRELYCRIEIAERVA